MIGRATMQSTSNVRCPLNRSGPRAHNRELNTPVAKTPVKGHTVASSIKRLHLRLITS